MLAALIVDGLSSQARKNLTPTAYDVGDPVWALYGDDSSEAEDETKSPKSAEGQFDRVLLGAAPTAPGPEPEADLRARITHTPLCRVFDFDN